MERLYHITLRPPAGTDWGGVSVRAHDHDWSNQHSRLALKDEQGTIIGWFRDVVAWHYESRG